MHSEEVVAERPSTRADARRRKLIESARRLFVSNGFHATGIAQIARDSGIAVGQIYRDFASKEEIVAWIVEEDCAGLCNRRALDEAIAQGDDERVMAWLLQHIELDGEIERRRLFAEIIAESGRNARIARIFSELHERLRAEILRATEVLAPGEQLGAERIAVADLLATFSLGLLHHQLMRPTLEVQPLEQRLREIMKAQLEQLRAAG